MSYATLHERSAFCHWRYLFPALVDLCSHSTSPTMFGFTRNTRITDPCLFLLILLLTASCTKETVIEPAAEDNQPPEIRWDYSESVGQLQGMIGLPFRVIEENEVDSVQVFVSGREGDGEVIDTVGENRHLYCWDSRSHPDGYYTFEVFARDQSGNVGRSPVLLTQVVNQALPRVLYVPDDDQTLQAAINAAREGDTIRVQPGIYNIGIMTWKRIIKKSESIATD